MTPSAWTEPALLKGLAVFVGAGTGGVARWLVGAGVQKWWGSAPAGPSSFPIGTLAVNVTGCLLIGIVAAALLEGGAGRGLRVFGEPGRELGVSWVSLLMVGVLGGYTTFSSFALESLMLARHQRWGALALYVGLSNALGLLAVWAGWAAWKGWGGWGGWGLLGDRAG